MKGAFCRPELVGGKEGAHPQPEPEAPLMVEYELNPIGSRVVPFWGLP